MKPRYPETEERKNTRLKLNKSNLPQYKITARRMLGKQPRMTKEELREMLTSAVKNTEKS